MPSRGAKYLWVENNDSSTSSSHAAWTSVSRWTSWLKLLHKQREITVNFDPLGICGLCKTLTSPTSFPGNYVISRRMSTYLTTFSLFNSVRWQEFYGPACGNQAVMDSLAMAANFGLRDGSVDLTNHFKVFLQHDPHVQTSVRVHKHWER